MLKQNGMLEVLKNDRVYQLHLPATAPLGEVHDVLFQMRTFVVNKINEALQADAPKSEEKPNE